MKRSRVIKILSFPVLFAALFFFSCNELGELLDVDEDPYPDVSGVWAITDSCEALPPIQTATIEQNDADLTVLLEPISVTMIGTIEENGDILIEGKINEVAITVKGKYEDGDIMQLTAYLADIICDITIERS
ncbi:MAG: hypothetical protein JW881_03820 [Spirochaetales bacterium]|nr:hypothetical protein [Spirochaetales bacterium]